MLLILVLNAAHLIHNDYLLYYEILTQTTGDKLLFFVLLTFEVIEGAHLLPSRAPYIILRFIVIIGYDKLIPATPLINCSIR